MRTVFGGEEEEERSMLFVWEDEDEVHSTDDDLYTVPEMNAADKILSEVYKKAGASDRYKCTFYPGEHKFDSDMQKEAFDWFDKWLK